MEANNSKLSCCFLCIVITLKRTTGEVKTMGCVTAMKTMARLHFQLFLSAKGKWMVSGGDENSGSFAKIYK